MVVLKNVSVFFGVLVLGLLIGYKINPQFQSKDISLPKKLKIAVLIKTAPYHENAAQGIINRLKASNKANYTVKIYALSGGPNLQLATSIVEEAVSTDPDLICTVGALLSKVTRAVTAKRKNKIPVVFIGATDPIELNLVNSLEKPATNFTGINMTTAGEDKAVHVLHFLKPNAKHVLLPYNPLASGGDVEVQAINAKQYLESVGVHVTLIPVHKLPEILPKVKGLIQEADTVMYLPGCIVDEAAEGLIKLCNQHHVSLFANQPSTVKAGAAFGYGTDARIIGEKSCSLIERILIDGEQPENMPVQFMDFGRRTAINLDAAKQQNLTVPEDILFFISRGVIYKNGHEV